MSSKMSVTEWIEVGRKLFARLFPGKALEFIVGPEGEDIKNAVRLRSDADGNTEDQVVSVREEKVAGKGEELIRAHVRPAEGIPLIEAVQIDAKEAEVLTVLEAERGALLGRQIAPRIGYKAKDSRPREILSAMKKRGLVQSAGGQEGYTITLKGFLSLKAYRANQLFEAG